MKYILVFQEEHQMCEGKQKEYLCTFWNYLHADNYVLVDDATEESTNIRFCYI
jgi:hypothetical protein